MSEFEHSPFSSRMRIAGIGAVSGYGWGRERLWNGLISGKPAAQLRPGYGADGSQDAWVAAVSADGDPADGPSVAARAVRAVAREAIADARERGWVQGARVGVLHALVLPEAYEWRDYYLRDSGVRSNRDYLTLMPSTTISLLMRENGFHGPAMNISAMCSSGNSAMVTAKMWLDTDFVDDVLVIATDISCTRENVAAFVNLGVAVVDIEPLDASRPFQEGSRGFGVGEASVAFMMSNQDTRAYASVLGGALSHDAHHPTSVDPSHEQIFSCVESALARSGVSASDVRYINAHGPGTAQCDRAETAILEKLFDSVPEIYSVKPLVGHCQGAAAAVELAAAALAYERGSIPASPHVATAHPRLLDGLTPMEPGITVKTSLGMGGHNSAVVLAPA